MSVGTSHPRSRTDSFLNIVRKSNNFLHSASSSTCVPFLIDGDCVGLVRPDILAELIKFDIFVLKTNESGTKELHLVTQATDVEGRGRELDEVLRKLRSDDCFVCLRGWRNEVYSIKQTFDGVTLLNMERAATSLLGVVQYGTHLNGYLYNKDGKMSMWIAERSLTKQTFPGLLDNMCAGGLPSGMGVRDCMEKEAYEEAGLLFGDDIELKSVGTISYFYEDERGLFPECQFVFDAVIPSSFQPNNIDREVKGFQLLPIEEVTSLIATNKFKFNCALVVLDFLIRHGVVTPDNEPRYAHLIEQMHVPLQTMFKLRNFHL